MKKFILIVTALVILYIGVDYAYYHLGWYVDLGSDQEVSYFMKTDKEKIYMLDGTEYKEFEIRGVNMGTGEPGQWSTDFHIDKESYMRWFRQIQEMGANTVRVYTIQADDFYNAFYEYNKNNENPLYLIQGVWLNDYIQNSHRDAYDEEFFGTFLEDCKIVVDVIHGNKKISLGKVASAGSGTYRHDVSQWVIGYILGVEWEDVTVIYTDKKYENVDGYISYQGTYTYTTADATPFEVMLAQVFDKIVGYESSRYQQQKLIAFSNWPTADPFDYPADVADFFMKCAKVDVEHIKTTELFKTGQFASYHVYPYYPDYLAYIEDWIPFGIGDSSGYYNEKGELNTYRAYLDMLTNHHEMPVVISEFGVSTGRGMAQREMNMGRNQGNMSEQEQGEAIISCYKDILASGCAGGCVFTWQDEWFKRTWNTMYAVDLKRTPYWSDYQTNEQYFGLLSFDPGEEKSICYVDGDFSEWTEEDLVTKNGDVSVSVKYDEKFLYFLIEKNNLHFGEDTIYLPIDTAPKTGSSYCQNYDLLFDRAADFLIVLHGEDDSRVQVQERYESLRSTYAENVYNFDTYEENNIPDKNSPLFVNIDMILQTATPLIYGDNTAVAETYETGLLTYGNANPESSEFNSLADFICEGNCIELKLPWQLLNFADPSRMQIHDDYYDGNYGVVHTTINELYIGAVVGSNSERVQLQAFALEGWENKVTWHERLKSSYYILQEYWNGESSGI